MGLGWPELILVLVIVLIMVGPRKLTGLGDALGRAVRSVRHVASEADHKGDPR
jgi:sec-independent protein translocase protein TatA